MNVRSFIFNLLVFQYLLSSNGKTIPILFEKTGKLSIKLLFFQTLGFNRGNRTVNTFLFDQLIELIAVYRY